MRIGIIANSLPLALNTYRCVKDLSDCVFFIILCANPERSNSYSLFANLARIALTPRVWGTSLLILGGRKLILFKRPLDDPDSVRRLSELKLDIGLHQSGIIYRAATINAFQMGILNAHIGILPEYRGRNVMEWSLLNGHPTGITVFFVDNGIDTGSPIVLSETIDVSKCRSLAEAKRYLFSLNGTFFRQALERLRCGNPQFQVNDGTGRRYFVMSKLFQDVASNLLSRN